MVKKKTKKIALIAAAVLVVASTAGAIYYFVNRNKVSKLATATLAEIISETRLPDKEYTNLDFSNAALSLPDVSQLNKYYIEGSEDIFTEEQCSKYCFELFDILFEGVKDENTPFLDPNDPDQKPLPDGQTSDYRNIIGDYLGARIEYDAGEEYKYYACVDADGRVYASAGTYSIYDELIATVHLDCSEELPDEEYQLIGGKYGTKQALKLAEDKIGEMSMLFDGVELSPTEFVILKDSESGNYTYKIQFEYIVGGVALNHMLMPGPNSDIKSYTITTSMLNIEIGQAGKITYVGGERGPVIKGDDGKLKDKYIPLDSAADLASEYLAPYFMQEISQVSIRYIDRCPHGGYAWDGMGDLAEHVAQVADEETAEREKKRYLTPCWCFKLANGGSNDASLTNVGNMVMVDMQTGEVIVYDSIAKRYMSSIDDSLESEELL